MGVAEGATNVSESALVRQVMEQDPQKNSIYIGDQGLGVYRVVQVAKATQKLVLLRVTQRTAKKLWRLSGKKKPLESDSEHEVIFSPDKNTKVSFKKILTGVGFAHSPGLLRFFAVTPELVIPVIFLTQFWIFASLIISTKHILNLKSNFKSFGVVFLSFLIIAFLSISFLMSRMDAMPASAIS